MATNHPAASRLRPGAVLAALATLALGCAEAPTSPRSSDVGTLSFAVNCNEKPDHPKCGGGGGDDGDGTSDQVNLAITLDDTRPAITSDGGAYVEGTDGVEAHFSGANGNLMFRTEAGPRLVRINVAGYDKSISVHRNYTNQNINFDDGANVDLRAIGVGDDVTAAYYVEWNDPDTGESFELRYGALCTEDKFDGDATNDSHRVEVDRVDADTWVIGSPPSGSESDKGGAVLCKGTKTGRSGKVTMSHVADVAPADAAFSMTLVRQP